MATGDELNCLLVGWDGSWNVRDITSVLKATQKYISEAIQPSWHVCMGAGGKLNWSLDESDSFQGVGEISYAFIVIKQLDSTVE